MKIGIDISQTAYQGTGVANYVLHLVQDLVKLNNNNEYILFFSSLRQEIPYQLKKLRSENVTIKKFTCPPSVLDFLWNRLHILPIEKLIGDVDIFISSDWTEPPTISAKKCTILYDLIVYKYPQETAKKIIDVQKRKLRWTKKECDKIMCISEATKKDAMEILGIEKDRLSVVYPGI